MSSRQEEFKCPECDTESPIHSKFCESCGLIITRAGRSQATKKRRPAPERSESRKIEQALGKPRGLLESVRLLFVVFGVVSLVPTALLLVGSMQDGQFLVLGLVAAVFAAFLFGVSENKPEHDRGIVADAAPGAKDRASRRTVRPGGREISRALVRERCRCRRRDVREGLRRTYVMEGATQPRTPWLRVDVSPRRRVRVVRARLRLVHRPDDPGTSCPPPVDGVAHSHRIHRCAFVFESLPRTPSEALPEPERSG